MAVHVTGLAPTQTPARQVSLCVHALPSLQAEPSILTGLLHAPDPTSQTPASWQPSSAAHTTGLLPVHVPDWQVSVCVQGLPSAHAVPSIWLGLPHRPVLGSHVPATWQTSLAVHTTGLPPVQVPFWQVSDCVQALASEHTELSALLGLLQAPVTVSQVPATWH